MTLLPFERQHHSTKQQSRPQHSTHYQTCDVISNGSRIGWSLHNGTRGSLHQNHIRRDGAQTTSNTTTNQQRNGRSSNQWKSATKTHKSYGHEVPLATRQRMPETVQNILATRKIKVRRLLDETSPDKASSTYEKRIHHTTNSD